MEVGEIVRRKHGKSIGSVAATDRPFKTVLVEWRRGKGQAPRQRVLEEQLVMVLLAATNLPEPKFNVNSSPMYLPQKLNGVFKYQPEIVRRFYSFKNKIWCYYLKDREGTDAWVAEDMLEDANAVR